MNEHASKRNQCVAPAVLADAEDSALAPHRNKSWRTSFVYALVWRDPNQVYLYIHKWAQYIIGCIPNWTIKYEVPQYRLATDPI